MNFELRITNSVYKSRNDIYWNMTIQKRLLHHSDVKAFYAALNQYICEESNQTHVSKQCIHIH